MALIKYNTLVEEVHGATSPGRIHRQKKFKDASGRFLGFAHPETYDITKPRDWNKTPPRKDELRNQQLWGKASYIAARELESDEGVAYWTKRFEAQLPRIRGSKPDPYASYDKKTKTRKRYIRFDAFVRAMVRNQLAELKKSTPDKP